MECRILCSPFEQAARYGKHDDEQRKVEEHGVWGTYCQDLASGKGSIAVLHGCIIVRELKLAWLANARGVKVSGPGTEQRVDVDAEGRCILKQPIQLGKDHVLAIQK